MAGVDWDDVLPEDLKAKWEKWVAELPQLSNVAVPRCLRQANPENIELHVYFQMLPMMPLRQWPIWSVDTWTAIHPHVLLRQSAVCLQKRR